MSMSIQSDVEILSVQAVEYYAQKHHLSEGDVFDLFCKHQVFEKILIQHETLHQLDMEETFQYVEEIIKENAPELVLYHGSNIAFDEIDLGKSHNRRDFGRGFYCTVLESQAEEWAKRLYLRSHKGGRYVLPLPVPPDRGPEDQALCCSGSGVAGVYQRKPHERRHPARL